MMSPRSHSSLPWHRDPDHERDHELRRDRDHDSDPGPDRDRARDADHARDPDRAHDRAHDPDHDLDCASCPLGLISFSSALSPFRGER